MSQFRDVYGILALAATKKITQEEDSAEMGEFFGELEKNLITVNSKLADRKEHTKNY